MTPYELAQTLTKQIVYGDMGVTGANVGFAVSQWRKKGKRDTQ
jgi:hypothetical protein